MRISHPPNVSWLNMILAVAFHFSRVGDDEGAKKLLEELDHDGGEHVDCLPGIYDSITL